MYNTIPDLFRQISINSLFDTPTFHSCWNVWKDLIADILPINFDENDIINLGDSLSDIFQSTGGAGRGQGELSAGGTAWESLVCYYINLCTVGSRVVAFRKMSLVPEPIRNAITVNYGNFACNTESDITVVVFPDKKIYNKKVDALGRVKSSSGKEHLIIHNGKLNTETTDKLCSNKFNEFEIGVIQCKTNWNDNAQIPMLWDMIYSSNGFRGRNITIGREGFNIHQASNFTYSFVTVPSNKKTKYKSESVSVKRVTNLSGGNYWGKATEKGIARSLKEIFTNNFQSGAKTDLRQDIRNAIPYLEKELSYFNLI